MATVAAPTDVSTGKNMASVMAANASLMKDIRSEFTEVALLATLAGRHRRISEQPGARQQPPATVPAPYAFAATQQVSPPRAAPGYLFPYTTAAYYASPQQQPVASPSVRAPPPQQQSPSVTGYSSSASAPDPLRDLQALLSGLPGGDARSPYSMAAAPAPAPEPAAPAYSYEVNSAPSSSNHAGSNWSSMATLNIADVSQQIRDSISRLEAATGADMRASAPPPTALDAHYYDQSSAMIPTSIIRSRDVVGWTTTTPAATSTPTAMSDTTREAAARTLASAMAGSAGSSPVRHADVYAIASSAGPARSADFSIPAAGNHVTATSILSAQSRMGGVMAAARRAMLAQAGGDAPSAAPSHISSHSDGVQHAPVGSSIARGLAAAALTGDPLLLTSINVGHATRRVSLAPAPSSYVSVAGSTSSHSIAAFTDRVAALQEQAVAAEAAARVAALAHAPPAPAPAVEVEQATQPAAAPRASAPPPPPRPLGLAAAAAAGQGSTGFSLRSRNGESYSEMLAAGVAAPGGQLPDDITAHPGEDEDAAMQPTEYTAPASAPTPAPAPASGGFMNAMGRMLRKSMSFVASPPAADAANGGQTDATEIVPDVAVGDEGDAEGVILKGNLQKCGSAFRNWTTRYCVLSSTELIYYTSAADAAKEMRTGTRTRRGHVDLTAAHVFLGPGRAKSIPTAFPFRIGTGKRDFVFAAANEDVRMSWIGALVAVTQGDLNEVLAGTAYAPSALAAAGVDIGDGEMDEDEEEDVHPLDGDEFDLDGMPPGTRVTGPGARGGGYVDYSALDAGEQHAQQQGGNAAGGGTTRGRAQQQGVTFRF